MSTVLRTVLVLCCLAAVPASTGYIEGTITAIGDATFVITGVNHYGTESSEPAEHTIPGKGEPIWILDGRLSTRDATLRVGRRCFVFWNRHTQQMVAALSGPDEEAPAEATAAPVPAGQYVHTVAGVIVSADEQAGTVVLQVERDGASAEVTVTVKKGKTLCIDGNRFNAPFASTVQPGRRAVSFCYRERDFPNFIVVAPAAEGGA